MILLLAVGLLLLSLSLILLTYYNFSMASLYTVLYYTVQQYGTPDNPVAAETSNRDLSYKLTSSSIANHVNYAIAIADTSASKGIVGIASSLPISASVLPPRIVMVYAGNEYSDDLISYQYRHGASFRIIDIPLENITKKVSLQPVVEVKNGSKIQFVIKGNPPVLPSSLSITAYDMEGKAVKVLNATQYSKSIFTVNLSKGKYILLAIATWLPEHEK
jgi:hypothetical protein